MKKIVSTIIALLVLVIPLVVIQTASANPDDIKVIGTSAVHVEGSGWTAGWVQTAEPGTHTYTLTVYPQGGGANSYPYKELRLLACISDAAHAGGITSISVESTELKMDEFIAGKPSYYPNGGVFANDVVDYYGYNDKCNLPVFQTKNDLYQIEVTITFADDAHEDTKILFLAYGIDGQNQEIKSPFSGGTFFVVPEYSLPIAGMLSCFAAFIIVKRKSLHK